MFQSILQVLRFRGASNTLLWPADKILARSVLWLGLIIIPMQVYRNFIVDPTPYAIPLLVCSSVALLICAPFIRVKPRLRLGLIAAVLIVFALLVQARNPNALFGSFHISTAAIIALLVASGTRGALAGIVVNGVGVALLVSLPADANEIQIISIAIGYSSSVLVIVGFLAGLLQAYETAESRYTTARQQIDSANSDRDRLLKSITLELRNPVATLRSLTYNANIPSGLATDLREVSKDLTESIDDLRYNLSPDAIPAGITLSDCHIVNLLGGVRRQVEPLMAERGVRLSVGTVRLPVTTYRLDTAKLRATLTTLLRHCAGGVGTRNVELKVYSEDIGGGLHRVYIEVADDGAHLPEETIQQVFGEQQVAPNAEFEQSDEAQSLNRLQQWLNDMGGTLHYEKIASQGARFIVALHIAPAGLHSDSEPDHTPVFNSEAMSALRIALLEQDRLLSRAAATLIKNLGAGNIEVYRDGHEFLRDFRGGRHYNMVLMDQRFRDDGGLDVLTELRGDRFDAAIIVLDSSPNESTAQRNRDAGANATAAKPLSLESLGDAFRIAAPEALTSAARVMSQFR